MTYPSSGSILNRATSSGLSTQMIVKVGTTTVGAIQGLTVTQTRNMLTVQEIGTDGVVEIHPQGAAQISLRISRVVFDGLRLTESFSRGFVNLQAQRLPFDIQVIHTIDGTVDEFKRCWFKTYSQPYKADNFLIAEEADIVCEYIKSSRFGLNVADGGDRGIRVEADGVERKTDINGRIGRLDSSGFRTL